MIFKKRAYKVKLKGRSGVEYSEGSKKMLISSEFMSGSNGIVIYSDSIRAWQVPNDKEIMIKSPDKSNTAQHNGRS